MYARIEAASTFFDEELLHVYIKGSRLKSSGYWFQAKPM
jgi:hypothetical protein